MLRPLSALVALLSLTSASLFTPSKRQSTACNNSPDLCSRAYNNILHLGAHNSPFRRDASTRFSTSGNQYYNSTVQLNAGVRLLSGQVHKQNGGYHLCHSSCDLLDAGTLTKWLQEIKAWLDNNPNDVVTILLVNSDDATPSDLAQQFNSANIVDYAYRPPSSTAAPESWPTLQSLIDADTRLMVFVGSLNPSQISASENYLMDEFTFIFENSFDNTAISDFSCTPDRPSAVRGNSQAAVASNRMPFTNHFLYEKALFDIQIPAVDNITVSNAPGSDQGMLGAALSACRSEYGRIPTFTLVDFFNEGPAIQAVDAVNGITAVGRTDPPPRDTGASVNDAKQASFVGVVDLNNQVKNGEDPSLGAWIWGAGKWSFGGINLSGGNVLGKK